MSGILWNNEVYEMNLPNKLTMMRIFLIPFVMIFVLVESIPHRWLLGMIFFIIASVTDMLDGKIARSRNLITDFGKLMDPVADKMLVMSTLVCFVQEEICGAWVVAIILFREFLVTSVRMVAADKGIVIPANIWGKVKTVTQMVAISGIFIGNSLLEFTAIPTIIGTILTNISMVILYAAVVATILSGAVYVYDSRDLFKDA